MKKLLIAAAVTAAALGSTATIADPTGHQRGKTQQHAAADCPMAGEHGNRDRQARGHERMGRMHERMAARHGGQGNRDGNTGRGTQGEHQH